MDITVQRLTTIVVDGVQEFPPATSAPVPDPLTIGTYTITANQSFTIIKSACPSECSALGAQTSPLRHSGGSIVADGEVEVPTYTTDVHGYHFRYTLGERSAVFTTASSGTLYLQEVASVATVLGASGPTVGFNAGGLVVDGTTLKPTTAATVMGMPRLPVTRTDAASSMLVGYTTVTVSQAIPVSTAEERISTAPPPSNHEATLSTG